jgi:hypothetical protein
LLGCGAIDLALNREDRVNATYRFDGQWRFAEIGELEEFATAVAPAGSLGDRAGFALGVIEIAKAGIGVGLEATLADWVGACTASLAPLLVESAATLPQNSDQDCQATGHAIPVHNTGKKVIAFTHKPVLGNDPVAVENRRLILAAIKARFTINLSADNPAQADRLAELGIAPVVTVLGRDDALRAVRDRFKRRRDEWAETVGEWRDRIASLPRHTPAGRRIAICPATYSDATCKTCGTCARVRDAVIGFPAHGAWRQVEAAVAARNVPARECWAFRDHRTMAEVGAEEATAA